MEDNYIIFDFDSTIIKGECLEILADLSLKNNPHKNKILEEIQKLTDLGMEGKISFTESFSMRMKLLSITSKIIEEANLIILKQITDSFLDNIDFFHNNSDRILIISGGFKECIYPVADMLRIKKDNIYANEFIYDSENNISGFDSSNPLSKEKGKVNIVQQLKLNKPAIIIGDGYSDYQIKESGLAEKFFVLTENIRRENVIKLADKELKSFYDFMDIYYPYKAEDRKLQPNII